MVILAAKSVNPSGDKISFSTPREKVTRVLKIKLNTKK
jgi:hypothetical protein